MFYLFIKFYFDDLAICQLLTTHCIISYSTFTSLKC